MGLGGVGLQTGTAINCLAFLCGAPSTFFRGKIRLLGPSGLTGQFRDHSNPDARFSGQLPGWKPVLPAKVRTFARHTFARRAKVAGRLMDFRQNGETREQRYFLPEKRHCDQLEESNSLVQSKQINNKAMDEVYRWQDYANTTEYTEMWT